MKTIRISAEVWDEMAKRGKFGDTPDDVLRRVFGLEGKEQGVAARKLREATQRMSAKIVGQHLRVSFEEGAQKTWSLPKRDDKAGIRRVREAAVEFARENGATHGQRNAVRKALTDAGYHLTK